MAWLPSWTDFQCLCAVHFFLYQIWIFIVVVVWTKIPFVSNPEIFLSCLFSAMWRKVFDIRTEKRLTDGEQWGEEMIDNAIIVRWLHTLIINVDETTPVQRSRVLWRKSYVM